MLGNPAAHVAGRSSKRPLISMGGLWFAPKPAPPPEPTPEPAKEKPKRPAVKNDPKLVAAARELRDRYLEQFNEQFNGGRFAPPAGKYDVAPPVAAPVAPHPAEARALPAARVKLLPAA